MLRGLFLFFKVGIVLHYSTLATVLWLGVTSRNIYKQVTKKAKRCQDTDEPPPPPRPMLRWACCLCSAVCQITMLMFWLEIVKSILFFSKCHSSLFQTSLFPRVRMRWRMLGLIMLLFQQCIWGFGYGFRLEHFTLNRHREMTGENCVIRKLTNTNI